MACNTLYNIICKSHIFTTHGEEGWLYEKDRGR